MLFRGGCCCWCGEREWGWWVLLAVLLHHIVVKSTTTTTTMNVQALLQVVRVFPPPQRQHTDSVVDQSRFHLLLHHHGSTTTDACATKLWLSTTPYSSSSSSHNDKENQQSSSEPPQQDNNDNNNSVVVHWCRSCIALRGVCLAYKVTLWRRLTSSVPRRRHWAVDHVTLSIQGGNHHGGDGIGAIGSSGSRVLDDDDQDQDQDHDDGFMIPPNSLVLLVGDSSSGKSTLLQIMAGGDSRATLKEMPTPTTTSTTSTTTCKGTIVRRTECPSIGSSDDASTADVSAAADAALSICRPATPIILDDRTPYSTTSKQNSLQERLIRRLLLVNDGNNDSNSNVVGWGTDTSSSSSCSSSLNKWQHRYLDDVAKACGMDVQLLHEPPSALSPSEYYKFRLVEACIDSSYSSCSSRCRPNLMDDDDDNNNDDTTNHGGDGNSKYPFACPGPILLLDEWMDVETSTVVQNVLPALHRIITDLGGIVVCVTHKPHLFSQQPMQRQKLQQQQQRPIQHQQQQKDELSSRTAPSWTLTEVAMSAGKILAVSSD